MKTICARADPLSLPVRGSKTFIKLRQNPLRTKLEHLIQIPFELVLRDLGNGPEFFGLSLGQNARKPGYDEESIWWSGEDFR
jgi:hypothetical protein